jgi:uncharacterized protein YqgC (DUF456 family)
MSGTTIFRGIAWLLVLAVAVMTLSPISQRPVTAAPADFERFLAFAMVGGAFCLGYPKHRIGVILLVIALVGVLELAQDLVPGRHGRLQDAALKAAGALFGIAIGMFIDGWKRSQ